jgi:hypothetical protein
MTGSYTKHATAWDNQDCLRSAVSTFELNWDAIVAELLRLRDPSKTILRTMDIYNPYAASDMKAGVFTTTEPYLDESTVTFTRMHRRTAFRLPRSTRNSMARMERKTLERCA